MAHALGLDPTTRQTIPCHLQSQAYTAALYAHAMSSPENRGVDYWWTDLCDLGKAGQGAGNQTNYRCLQDTGSGAALWSNMVHASRASSEAKRGMVLTIYGGLGNHRYPQVLPPASSRLARQVP
jgi:hypothetical protein